MSREIGKIENFDASGKVSDSFSKNKNLPLNAGVFNQELSSALLQLSSMDNSEKLRADAISNGKAIIKNWTPPTDDQIDKIFMSMSKDLLA